MVWANIKHGLNRLWRDKRGNTMFLTAAAVVPVIGIVGSGVDIGRAYMAELRLQQACDAGVLAGRRAMTGTSYDSASRAEADKMFNYNFPDDTYGSSQIAFNSQAQGTNRVSGIATAELPTALMQVFNFPSFNLSVNCTAKLEIANADIMMVLDVTGSMDAVNSGDSVSRIQALKTASINFFDTLTGGQSGDGRLRFGVVPYSGAANVGAIIMAKNPDWISDNDLLPSRSPIYTITYGNGQTQDSQFTDGTTSYGSWSNVSTVNGKNSSTCGSLTPPADTSPSPSGTPTTNQTGQVFDGAGNRVTSYSSSQTYAFFNYHYVWLSKRCRLQRRTATFTRTSTYDVVEEPIQTFSQYRYEDRNFDVSTTKTGSDLVTDTGDKGAEVSVAWPGCLQERATTQFASTETAPADAYDMDIDLVPTSDDDTKWKLFLPKVTFSRSSTTPVTTSTDSQNFYEKSVNGDLGACPVAAMKLTTMTAGDRASFVSYINSLVAWGFTYHDAGMVWGARLLSPDGLFSDENMTAPNGQSISRHIVFMTDGDMNTPRSNYSHQGQESAMPRIGATSDSDAIARHNNRFLQLCAAVKAKNVTIWVVSLATSVNSQLQTCASAGKAYAASNAAALNSNFQLIASQISKLRLSE